MPRVLDRAAGEPIGFEAFVDALDAADFDPRDEEAFAALGPLLGRLAVNRTFLADRAVAELESRCRAQAETNGYGTQVLMLHRAPGYFVRANFWPSPGDSLMRASGGAPFFYGIPHDHNFSFLTAGYFGPGYWSDYYEYDYGRVAGYPGEKAGLRFVERSRLDEGRILLYRAHRDVHRQLPADSLSISLNIMGTSEATGWLDQYRFDVERGEVAELLSVTPAEMLMRLAVHLGGEEGAGLVGDFARGHPSDRIRFAAIAARADAAGGADARLAALAAGCGDPSRQVRELCRLGAETIEANRGWLGCDPD